MGLARRRRGARRKAMPKYRRRRATKNSPATPMRPWVAAAWGHLPRCRGLSMLRHLSAPRRLASGPTALATRREGLLGQAPNPPRLPKNPGWILGKARLLSSRGHRAHGPRCSPSSVVSSRRVRADFRQTRSGLRGCAEGTAGPSCLSATARVFGPPRSVPAQVLACPEVETRSEEIAERWAARRRSARIPGHVGERSPARASGGESSTVVSFVAELHPGR